MRKHASKIEVGQAYVYNKHFWLFLFLFLVVFFFSTVVSDKIGYVSPHLLSHLDFGFVLPMFLQKNE